jgi:hypothetical protein
MDNYPTRPRSHSDIFGVLIDDARVRFEIETRRCEQADTQAIALAAIAGTLGLLIATGRGKGPVVTMLAAAALILVTLSIIYALFVRLPGFLLRGTRRDIARLEAAIADSQKVVRESQAQDDVQGVLRHLLFYWEARIDYATYCTQDKEYDLRWSLVSLLGAAIAATGSVLF